MRNIMLLLLIILGFCSDNYAINRIVNSNEITEEWLIEVGSETGYTEHVRHFKRLFNKIKVRTFLEFGLGFSTKYFMDNCEKVISVEFVTPGSGPEWLKYCIDLYRNEKNWIPIAYFSGKNLDTRWAPYKYMGIESVYDAAAYQPVHCKSYALIDPSFLGDLDNFIKQQVSTNTVDVAFVDAGICIRGDLVQLLFNKVPIIVAHDVAAKEVRHLTDVYGYGRVVAPENYEEVRVPFGMGTAFWIIKEPQYLEIIKDLKQYVADGEKY